MAVMMNHVSGVVKPVLNNFHIGNIETTGLGDSRARTRDNE
jgi:hypothetical protein